MAGVRHSLERREVPFISFDRHVYFMDLRENANLSSASMEYVSIVRDPVDKIVSRYAPPTPTFHLRWQDEPDSVPGIEEEEGGQGGD